MTIRLPEHLRRFVHDQVRAGRYSTETEVINDALEQLRKHAQPIANSQGLIGALRDDAELLDQAVEHAMKVHEERPWRLTTGE
jgi:putative addiction module CopG family antidote